MEDTRKPKMPEFDFEDLSEVETENEAMDLRRMSEVQKQNPEPLPYVINGIATEGDVTVIAGAGGVGKSWLAYHMMKCTATGNGVLQNDNFNDFTIERPGNVLLVDNENGRRRVDNRMRRLDRFGDGDMSVAPHDVFVSNENAIWKSDFREDGSPGPSLVKLMHTIDKIEPSLVVFDSFVSILKSGLSENNAGDIRDTLGYVQAAVRTRADGTVREHPPAILVLHHAQKRKRDDRYAWPIYRGSTDIRNISSVLIEMRKSPDEIVDPDGVYPKRRMQFRFDKSRDDEESEDVFEFRLKDHDKNDMEKSRVEFMSFGKVDKERMKKDKTNGRPKKNYREKILNALSDGYGIKKKELLTRCGLKSYTRGFNEALEKLSTGGGMVQEIKNGRSKLYKLKQTKK